MSSANCGAPSAQSSRGSSWSYVSRAGRLRGDGECAECANDQPYDPFWSKLRPQYVICPSGHRVHVECLHLRPVDDELDVEALCPRCMAA
jgi:hypothetical protein